jgi:type I restriction enzyme S subunit
MSKQAKKGLVPELRFPEFRNKPDWESLTLESVGETINGLAGKSGEDFGEGEPYVTYKQVFASSVVDLDLCSSVKVAEGENQNALAKGDVLLTTSSETPDEVGFASVLLSQPERPTYLNSFCFAFRPYDQKEHTPEFLRYLFRSPIYRKRVTLLAQGSTRYNISKSGFLGLSMPVPRERDEQLKVAACLSSGDALLAAEREKLEALRAHKKGLMQQLFPAEGKKVPELRFPGFGGEWEPSPIGAHVDLLSGFAFDGKDIVEDQKGTRLMRGINITEGAIRHSADIDRYYLGPVDELERYKLRAGDLVIGMDGSKVGKNVSLIDQAEEGTLLVQRVARLRARSQTLIGFIFHHIHSQRFHSYVDRINTSSGIPHISAQQIKDFTIAFPSEAEQHAVNSCLTSLNERIASQAERIEALVEHKKGLMQGLFPG